MTVCAFSEAQSCQTLATPWTAAHQAPLSIGFPRQEFWSELPFPSPRDLPDPVESLLSPALAGGFFTTSIVLTYYTQEQRGEVTWPGQPCRKLGVHLNELKVLLGVLMTQQTSKYTAFIPR